MISLLEVPKQATQTHLRLPTNLQVGDPANMDLTGYTWASVPNYLVGGTQLKTLHKYIDNGQEIKITVTDGYALYVYLIYDRLIDQSIDDGGWGPGGLSEYVAADGEVYSWTKLPDAELPRFTYTGNFTNAEIVVGVWYIRVNKVIGRWFFQKSMTPDTLPLDD